MVELLKAVVAGSRLIVLENVDAFISESELAKLQEILLHYARKGISFLCLSAHFEETLCFCSRTALEVNALYYKNLRNVDLRMNAGERVVVQDMDDCALSDFLAVLEHGRPERGQLLVGGRPLAGRLDRSIAIVQEWPMELMLFYSMSYMDNLCFNLDHCFPGIRLSRGMRRSIREEYAPVLGAEVFDKRIDGLTSQQKYDLVFTRLLLQRPRVVFFIHPLKRPRCPFAATCGS